MNPFNMAASEEVNSLRRNTRFKIPRPWIVLSLLLGALVILRLPSIFFNHELNPDESQMLSQGMKFLVDPRPWKAVDGTTAGPLNSYFLTLFLVIGFQPGFILLHAVSTLLAGLQVLVAHRTLLRLASEKTAALGALLVCLTYGIAGSTDYLHYSSELIPIVLLGVGFYCFVARLEGNFQNRPFLLLLLAVAGVALGSAPWAKLQALPIAGALGAVMLAAGLFGRDASFVSPPRSRVLEIAVLCFGATLPSAAMLVVLWKTGAMDDFWRSYILNNLAYSGPMNWFALVQHSVHLLVFTPLNQPIMIGLLAMSLLVFPLPANWFLIPVSKSRWIFTGLMVYTAAAFFAAARPNHSLHHHGAFLGLPLTYIGALLFSQSLNHLFKTEHPFSKWRKSLAVATIAATLILYIGWGVRQITWIVAPRVPDPNERMAGVIHDIERTRSVRSLAIWGWAPGVYVLTGLPPATRDSIAQFVILKGPFQAYYRNRFLGDLEQNPPDVFLDVAVPGTIAGWETDDRYESDADLKKFINDRYSLAAELPLIPNALPARFFVRNARETTSADGFSSVANHP